MVEARSLRVGDALLLVSGETATITALSTRQAHVLVYNLRVENNHTYAVSQAGVLVHNKAMQIKPVAGVNKAVGEMTAAERRAHFIQKGVPENEIGPSGWGLESGTDSVNPTDFDTETYPIWNSDIRNRQWIPPL